MVIGLLEAPCEKNFLCADPYARCVPKSPPNGARVCACSSGYKISNGACHGKTNSVV